MRASCTKCAELQARLDDLEWLEGLLVADDFEVGVDLHLRPSWKAILKAIVAAGSRGQVATYGFIAECLGTEVDQPVSLLKVHMSHIRRAIGSFGVEISTVWGVGYKIDSHNIQLLMGEAHGHPTQETAA